MAAKKVLNVGGNSKEIALPRQYANYEHVLLDIDPKGAPDIVCDARELATLDSNQFDAVYCSHNSEHYYAHDVSKVLAGFVHVLKADGFAQIRVPDIIQVMKLAIEKGLDVEDVLYHSDVGPIRVLDVLYGHASEIEESGQDFYAHKTGFSARSLYKALLAAGFSNAYCSVGHLEINAKGRTYDYSPSVDTISEREIEAAFGLSSGTIKSGGASRFLNVIKTEIAPFVEKHYKTNGDKGITGHSVGYTTDKSIYFGWCIRGIKYGASYGQAKFLP